MQDAIARVRAYQHAYNAPDPPSKRGFTWHVRRSDASLNRMLVSHPEGLWAHTDGRLLGLGSSGLRSNHDGPFMGEMWNLDNDQYGTGGNRPLSATTSNTTFTLAANNFLGTQPQQVTPAEVLPVNWLAYLVNSLPSGEFEDAVEGFEEQARKRFKRERR